MPEQDKPVKLTVQIHDRALYRAVRHLAVEQDRSLREIVVEALRSWVLKQEEQEDLAAIAETEGEENYSWDHVRAELHQGREGDRVA